MIIKEADDKRTLVAELEACLTAPALPADKKQRIEREIRFIAAGMKGERESAYDIDFYSGHSLNRVVIHDLRIEHHGRVAQIDHLVINRLLEVYVLETKHFNEGVSINEQGEFAAWFGSKPQGIPSPLEQNDRHIAVLQDVFKELKMPTRLGFRLQPSFESVVLVSKNARISRPRQFDSTRVIKSDLLEKWMERNSDHSSPLQLAKVVSLDTLTDIAQQLVALHRPGTFDFRTRFGITEEMLALPPETPAAVPAAALTAEPEMAAQADGKAPPATSKPEPEPEPEKLTTSRLARKAGLRTAELTERLVALGLLEMRDGTPYITPAGKQIGGEFRVSKKFGPYFLWPAELKVSPTD